MYCTISIADNRYNIYLYSKEIFRSFGSNSLTRYSRFCSSSGKKVTSTRKLITADVKHILFSLCPMFIVQFIDSN